jgi:flagellar biosynthesis component FlhA
LIIITRNDNLFYVFHINKFSKIEEKEADTVKVKDKTKLILSGGKNLIATADQYKHIVDKIRNIRNSFTLTK